MNRKGREADSLGKGAPGRYLRHGNAIDISELPKDLAGSLPVAGNRAETDLDDRVPIGYQGRSEVREATEIVHSSEERPTPSAEARNYSSIRDR